MELKLALAQALEAHKEAILNFSKDLIAIASVGIYLRKSYIITETAIPNSNKISW